MTTTIKILQELVINEEIVISEIVLYFCCIGLILPVIYYIYVLLTFVFIKTEILIKFFIFLRIIIFGYFLVFFYDLELGSVLVKNFGLVAFSEKNPIMVDQIFNYFFSISILVAAVIAFRFLAKKFIAFAKTHYFDKKKRPIKYLLYLAGFLETIGYMITFYLTGNFVLAGVFFLIYVGTVYFLEKNKIFEKLDYKFDKVLEKSKIFRFYQTIIDYVVLISWAILGFYSKEKNNLYTVFIIKCAIMAYMLIIFGIFIKWVFITFIMTIIANVAKKKYENDINYKSRIDMKLNHMKVPNTSMSLFLPEAERKNISRYTWYGKIVTSKFLMASKTHISNNATTYLTTGTLFLLGAYAESRGGRAIYETNARIWDEHRLRNDRILDESHKRGNYSPTLAEGPKLYKPSETEKLVEGVRVIIKEDIIPSRPAQFFKKKGLEIKELDKIDKKKQQEIEDFFVPDWFKE